MKEQRILTMLDRFFSAKRKYIDTLISYLQNRSTVSVRNLEAFVTKLSREYPVQYRIKYSTGDVMFNVNDEYKNLLNGYSKKYLDPFRRRTKIYYKCQPADATEPIRVKTTIGQLNFFQWAIKNRVIMYMERHYDTIYPAIRRLERKTRRRKQRQKELLVEEPVDDPLTPDMDICSNTSIGSSVVSVSARRPKRPKRLASRKANVVHRSCESINLSFD